MLDPSSRRRLVVAVVVAAAVGGALSGAHPTDVAAADVVLSAALAGVVAWAASWARRWTWSWLAGVAAVAGVGQPVALGFGLAALAVSLWSLRGRRRRRTDGVLVGALGVQALLRLGDLGPFGLTAVLAAAAVVPVLLSGYALLPRRVRRRTRRVALGFGVAVGVVAVAAGVAALLVRERLESAADRAEAAIGGVGDADREGVVAELQLAEADFSAAAGILRSPLLAPARIVPVVGQHLAALRGLADAGEELSATGRVNLEQVDYDRLRYRDGRIDLDEVAAMREPLEEVRTSLLRAGTRAEVIASPWLLPVVGGPVEDFGETVARTRERAETARLALDLAPAMLGADGPRRFLVVFPTPAEMRGGGGFVGNYAVLEADKGRVRMIRSERTRRLSDGSGPPVALAGLDEYLARYGRFEPASYPQDLLFSPHFPWNAEAYAQVAARSGVGPVDGVISVDAKALAALMSLTGPVPVEGRTEPLRPQEAEQWLLFDQYLEFQDNEERIDALEQLAKDTFDRLTEGSLPPPRELADLFGPLARGLHLQMYAGADAEQGLLDRLGVSGSLAEAGGHDFLHVSGLNGGHNKIDVFLEREVHVEPSFDPATGEVSSRVRVVLRNLAPSEGLPRYVIGNNFDLPPGTNRHLFSIYSPLFLEEARLDGEVVALESGRERGYKVYGRYVEIPPGATRVVELDLKGVIPDMKHYALVIRPQVMAVPDRVTVAGPAVAGRLDLVLDQERSLPARER